VAETYQNTLVWTGGRENVEGRPHWFKVTAEFPGVDREVFTAFEAVFMEKMVTMFKDLGAIGLAEDKGKAK